MLIQALRRLKLRFIEVFYNKMRNKWTELSQNNKLFKKIYSGLIFFFSGCHLIGRLKTVLKSGDLQEGIAFLNSKYPLFKPRSIKFLKTLYFYLQTLDDAIDKDIDLSRKQFIIHFSVWGERYAKKAIDFLLPSLLATDNLPYLAQKYQIFLLIHCDLNTKEALLSSAVSREIEKYAKIHYVVLPNHLFSQYQTITQYPEIGFLKAVNSYNHGIKYLLLGALQAHAFKISLQSKSLISFLIPDSILSDSFYSHVLLNMKDKKIALTSTFRSDFNKAKVHLESFYTNENKLQLAMPGKAMAKLQIEYLHPTEHRRVISKTTNHFLACARFIFKTKKGLILQAVHYHPVLIDCNKIKSDLKIDYFPIDDAVLKEVLQGEQAYEEQVWICSDPNKMNFMELSDENPEVNEPPIYVAPSTYEKEPV